jgi:hypothetical protein
VLEKKLKHLGMLQVIIQRMTTNSFLLKGWSVILVSAIFALASGPVKFHLVYLAYLPAVMFWILDGFFLHQERLFRKLYDKVRNANEEAIDFSIDTTPVTNQVASWPSVMFSLTLFIFHGAIVLTITLVWLVPLLCRFVARIGNQ